jgi:hypothetical protein
MIRTGVALGIAAVALTLTGLVSSSAPANAAPLIKPDLRVNFLGNLPGSSDYHFRVTNIGAASSGPIAVKELCAYMQANGPTKHVPTPSVLPGLGSGKSADVDFHCDVAYGVSSMGGRLEVGTQNDLDTSNNHAESEFYSLIP